MFQNRTGDGEKKCIRVHRRGIKKKVGTFIHAAVQRWQVIGFSLLRLFGLLTEQKCGRKVSFRTNCTCSQVVHNQLSESEAQKLTNIWEEAATSLSQTGDSSMF